MKEYEIKANNRDLESILLMIDANATYWFSDGSYTGTDEIREAFERTWATIKDEEYTIKNLKWITNCEHVAVCVYEFRSKGVVEGLKLEYGGRGTNVLRKFDGGWKIVHEHLSREQNGKRGYRKTRQG